MKFTKYLATVVALSVAAAPALAAAANPAASLSLAHSPRAATKTVNDSELFGASTIAVAFFLAVAITLAIVVIDGDDNATSP